MNEPWGVQQPISVRHKELVDALKKNEEERRRIQLELSNLQSQCLHLDMKKWNSWSSSDWGGETTEQRCQDCGFHKSTQKH